MARRNHSAEFIYNRLNTGWSLLLEGEVIVTGSIYKCAVIVNSHLKSNLFMSMYGGIVIGEAIKKYERADYLSESEIKILCLSLIHI